MRKKIVGCVLFLSFAALMSGGCAKKDMVKAEEPIPSTQTAPPAKPETVRPTDESTRPAPVQPAPIVETPTRESIVTPETPLQQGDAQGSADLQNQLQKIYFNFDSAALSDESRSILSKNADVLIKQSSVKIRIEGNSDERGSDEYNLALGERRAQAARDYLVNLGVQPERISVISYGEEKPAVAGHDEAAWEQNRRAEFVIVR
jgi:peptidoglycan-associated lipoprotein